MNTYRIEITFTKKINLTLSADYAAIFMISGMDNMRVASLVKVGLQKCHGGIFSHIVAFFHDLRTSMAFIIAGLQFVFVC
ncbi:MAG: hypothetical protein LBF43_00365 [Puniceicoccales bacterium]|nr:hypothetical protein [Puniceicoccales bacterium]